MLTHALHIHIVPRGTTNPVSVLASLRGWSLSPSKRHRRIDLRVQTLMHRAGEGGVFQALAVFVGNFSRHVDLHRQAGDSPDAARAHVLLDANGCPGDVDVVPL